MFIILFQFLCQCHARKFYNLKLFLKNLQNVTQLNIWLSISLNLIIINFISIHIFKYKNIIKFWVLVLVLAPKLQKRLYFIKKIFLFVSNFLAPSISDWVIYCFFFKKKNFVFVVVVLYKLLWLHVCHSLSLL